MGQAPGITPGSTAATGTSGTAPASRSQQTAAAPVSGANSFTEGQAKSRIESAGFSNIRGLSKDDQGIWRGQAERGRQQVEVSMDFQGTVTPGR
jgi:putative membrane protein